MAAEAGVLDQCSEVGNGEGSRKDGEGFTASWRWVVANPQWRS